MEETTYRFIGKWVLDIPGEVIDKLDGEFDVDYDDRDMEAAILNSDPRNPRSIGLSVWLEFMHALEDTLKERYGSFDEDKFGWDTSGGSDYYTVSYDGHDFSTKEQFERLIA